MTLPRKWSAGSPKFQHASRTLPVDHSPCARQSKARWMARVKPKDQPMAMKRKSEGNENGKSEGIEDSKAEELS